jgi:hypothetical protein
MKKTGTLERFGGLIKEESLTCLQDDILVANTCVLESVSPFFGYYSHEPQALKPRYLYCVLSGYFSLETLIRATQNIRKQYSQPFDAAIGTISVFDFFNQVIRIRNLQHYNHISTLQSLFIEEGITFKKKFRKLDGEMTVIKLRKFFFLEPAGNDIFIDKAQPHHAYFTIPQQIDWEQFKRITDQVKFDPNFFYFDGAIAFIYEQGRITDLIRIYREDFTLDEIREIRARYLKLLNEQKPDL